MADCRVLVVEDDQDTREALVELLQAEGYCASGATNGAQALAMLRAGEFVADVIIVDLHMPSMSGQELRCALRAESGLAHIPVIICTGSTPLADVGKDVLATLEKPFDIDALLAVVQRGCAASKPDRALSA